MISTADIRKLSAFIEENTRASETSGITYIDPNNFKSRILLKQNHIIFGRRGAGKSSLIKTLKESESKPYFFSYINLEDLKDISFPNILIQVLKKFESEISKQLRRETKWYHFRRKFKTRKLIKSLRQGIEDLKRQIPNPDSFDEEIKTKSSSSSTSNLKLKIDPVEAGGSHTNSNEIEVAKKINRDKLDSLKNSIPVLKESIKEINNEYPQKPIYLILDDFYFLKKQIQIFFIDFFHRLTKDTNLFIKIATIKHRSKIYSKLDGTYFGTEIGSDIHPLDLDQNLDRFEELKSFMRTLIEECSKLCNIKFNIDEVFSPGAFSQLCLSSGGVPRDFLTLFVKVSNNYDSSQNRRISKPNITEAAIQNMASKNANLGTDSVEEKEVLENYLAFIKNKIIAVRKTNMFLISNNEIDRYPQIKQAIKELMDLRMLHLVETGISSAHGVSGQRYSAYMVDIGLYPSSHMIGFKELDPGVTDNKGRKDELRGSPIIDLDEYKEFIDSKNLKQSLEVSEE